MSQDKPAALDDVVEKLDLIVKCLTVLHEEQLTANMIAYYGVTNVDRDRLPILTRIRERLGIPTNRNPNR